MDPDYAWSRAVAIAHGLLQQQDAEAGEPDPQDAAALAELVSALDSWLGKGGFPPRAFLATLAGGGCRQSQTEGHGADAMASER